VSCAQRLSASLGCCAYIRNRRADSEAINREEEYMVCDLSPLLEFGSEPVPESEYSGEVTDLLRRLR